MPSVQTETNITQCVVNSIIPSVKKFLLKDEVDHKGNNTKTVQPLVAVALTKLIIRLQPPAVSEKKKHDIFINLVMNVVTTLKSRDASARDIARDSLVKIIRTMGVLYLRSVINELHHSLNEGYQRHVRNYTLKFILSNVLDEYAPSFPVDDSFNILEDSDNVAEVEVVLPPFDTCIPLIMSCVMDDINGLTHSDREAEGAVRSLIREAKGNKANETLEICAKNILFQPTNALRSGDSEMSSIHAMITPLLDALRGDDCPVDIIGRVSEALQRVSLGLSRNPSVRPQELLIYLHATLQPFVAMTMHHTSHQAQNDGSNDLVTEDLPSYLRDISSSDDESNALLRRKSRKKEKNVVSLSKVKTWLPFDTNRTGTQQVLADRDAENKMLTLVQDGASAPKMTGKNRYKIKSENAMQETETCSTVVVRFCLNLMLSCIRQGKIDSADLHIQSMAAPFVPLLFQCLKFSGTSQIVILSMRCLCSLLSWGVHVDSSYSKQIAKQMFKKMYQGGALLNSDNDLVQSCIKGLTSLFQMHNRDKTMSITPLSIEVDQYMDEESTLLVEKKAIKEKSPLSLENIKALLSLMTASIIEITSSNQTAAFQLVRSIIDCRILVPEIYDLISKLIEQISISHRKKCPRCCICHCYFIFVELSIECKTIGFSS